MSLLLSLLCVAAAAPSAETTLLVEPLATSEARPYADKIGELLRARLEASGAVTVSDDELLARAGNNQGSAALLRARESLAAGKELYLRLETKEAAEVLGQARSAFQRALLEAEAFEPFAETLAYQGAAYLDQGMPEQAQAAFLELLRVRPELELDAAVYPPQVLEAFERAKEAAKKLARGSLQVVSSPPLATVVVDGLLRGQTPLTLPALVEGAHAVRVELPGRQPWWGMVDVGAAGTRITVQLEEEVLATRLAHFREDLLVPTERKQLVARARELLQAARADAVVAFALEERDATFLVSAVRLVAGKEPALAWTAIDKDLFAAEEAASALVRALLTSTTEMPVFASAGVAPPARGPDFSSSLLGMHATPPRAPLAAAGDRKLAPRLGDDAAAADEEGTPLWLWTVGIGGGVVVLAAVLSGVGVGVWALAQPAEEIRQPDTVRFEVGVSQ